MTVAAVQLKHGCLRRQSLCESDGEDLVRLHFASSNSSMCRAPSRLTAFPSTVMAYSPAFGGTTCTSSTVCP